MAVPTTITDLSTTANSNSPAGSEVPSSGNGPDEYIRALGSIVRVLRAKGSDVASATTTDLGAATTGDFVHVTGTTTITGLGTVAAGIKKIVTFDGALTLTHNGTSLILPGAANITTAANDVAVFVSEGSGNWRCVSYMYAAGVVATSANQTWNGTQTFRDNKFAITDNSDTTKSFVFEASGITTSTQRTVTLPDKSGTMAMTSDITSTVFSIGQCRLSSPTSTSLKLSPQAGNLLTVNGTQCTIPDAGVTLSAAPGAANTTYYIYAVATAGVITSIEASATAWAFSTTTGNKGTPIKSGDDTRTLVGMARGNGSTQWADSVTERFVLNYWNRRSLDLTAAFTAGRSYSSSSWGEINTEIRNSFLTWADECVNVACTGGMTASVAGSTYSNAIGIDGTTPEDGGTYNNDAAAGQAGSLHPICAGATRTLSEGYHYATLLAVHGGGSSGSYAGAASGNVRCAVRTIVRG